VAEIPTTNAAMARLCKRLAPDAEHRGLGMVVVEGEAGKVSTWMEGTRWAYDLVTLGLDVNDEPDDHTTSGHIDDRKSLALLLGVVLGLRSATDYADDPEAYLRDRARSGVARG
jgi:hypothetical protein